MFGEKGIYGQSEAFVDDKNRMILPKYTFRETGDSLVIVENKESKCFDMYNEKHYSEKLRSRVKFLEERYLTASNEKEKINIQKCLNEIYESIVGNVTCDKQGRVVITSIIDKDEHINKIKIIGAYDHIMLRKK